jgi:hypothetical protein
VTRPDLSLLDEPRQKDRVDIIELVKVGVDIDACPQLPEGPRTRVGCGVEDSVRKAAAEE